VYRVIDKAVLFLPPASVEPEALKQIENTGSSWPKTACAMRTSSAVPDEEIVAADDELDDEDELDEDVEAEAETEER
jgi:hypothetical protein